MSFTAMAQDVDPAIAAMTPEQKVETREAAMKENGGILKGAGQLSGAEAVAAADTLIANFTKFPALFSEDTKSVSGTKAKAEIWSDWEKFAAIFDAALEGASAMKVAAQSGDSAAYGASLKAIGGTCGECHQVFRSK